MNNLPNQLAKHLRDIHFGGNWTFSNLKDTLSDVSWQQANKKVYDFNTIVSLTFHINYFINAVIPVFEGEKLDAHDKYSYAHPTILSEEDWNKMLEKTWNDTEKLASLIEKMPESLLWEDFTDKKYGNYYRNIHGIIEHAHYHLGQIVIIKKLILQDIT